MAGYDSSLDKVVNIVGQTDGGIRVSVHSYDGGPEKVGLVRVRTKNDGTEKYGRVGRMTMEELQEVIPLLHVAKWEQLEEGDEDEDEVQLDAGELAGETTSGPSYEPDPDLDGDCAAEYAA